MLGSCAPVPGGRSERVRQEDQCTTIPDQVILMFNVDEREISCIKNLFPSVVGCLFLLRLVVFSLRTKHTAPAKPAASAGCPR